MTSPSSIRKCFVTPNAVMSRRLSHSPGLPVASATMATEEISGETTVMHLTVDQLQSMIASTIEEATQKKKRKTTDITVSKVIQNEVHKAVSHLGETDKSWDFSVNFRDGQNPQITREIMDVISNRLGAFDKDMAYKASRTYFLTLKAQDKKIKKGQMEETRKQQRRRQRRSNARSRRSTILKKMKSVSHEDRDNLDLILGTNDYMSSEESVEKSDTDEDGDEVTKVLQKKKLPWRSDYLNNWFQILDEKADKRAKKLRKGGGNMYNREDSFTNSRREKPEDAPGFALN